MNQHYERRLILESRVLVQNFRSKIKLLRAFDADENKIFLLITEAIYLDSEAQLELEYTSLAIISECIGKEYEGDIELLLKLVVEIGMKLHQLLVDLGVYQNDKLFFIFEKCVGSDIMLKYHSK